MRNTVGYWHLMIFFLSSDVETFRLQLQREAKLSQQQSITLQKLENDYETMRSQLEQEKSKLELSLEEKEMEIKMMKVVFLGMWQVFCIKSSASINFDLQRP